MKLPFYSLLSLSVAIFSMYFGAGNLIYPLIVGRDSGVFLPVGFFGFFLSGILIPLTGLIAMVLFEGNYVAFFQRLGTKVGNFFIFCCMLIMGPLIVMPRIITLSHIMISPLLSGTFLYEINYITSTIFALIFLTITYFSTYKERRVVDLLGIVVGPLLLLTLIIIILRGIFLFHEPIITPDLPLSIIFLRSLFLGYGTLDLLGSIFFSSAIGVLLQKTYAQISLKERAFYTLISGLVAVIILALTYVGLSIIGMLHGSHFFNLHAGDLFREISLHIMGTQGSLIVALAVCMACLSTAIAIAISVAEYTQKTLFQEKIRHKTSLFFVLISCLPLSIFGLETILALANGPLLYIGYPTLITVTICNILYKLHGVQIIKQPVCFVFSCSTILYILLYFFF